MLYELRHSLAVIKPTQLFFKWLHTILTENESFITLEALRINANSYLIPEIGEVEEGILYIDERFEDIFAIELNSWMEDSTAWPDLTLKNFWEWFDVEIHTSIIDLTSSSIPQPDDDKDDNDLTTSVTIH